MRGDSSAVAAASNARPKYVASTTLTDPQWADTTVLSGDVAAAIGEPKAKPGGELQVHGSGNLVRWLLDNHLVDELTLLTYPVVVGQGTRLFPAAGPDTALELVDSRATPTGVTIQVYRPTGRPRYATDTADANSAHARRGTLRSSRAYTSYVRTADLRLFFTRHGDSITTGVVAKRTPRSTAGPPVCELPAGER